jgi:hypothetical protein
VDNSRGLREIGRKDMGTHQKLARHILLPESAPMHTK